MSKYAKYDNFLVIDDFNSNTPETTMINFCDMYHLRNLVKDPTCYENPNRPLCTDLTNFPNSLMETQI